MIDTSKLKALIETSKDSNSGSTKLLELLDGFLQTLQNPILDALEALRLAAIVFSNSEADDVLVNGIYEASCSHTATKEGDYFYRMTCAEHKALRKYIFQLSKQFKKTYSDFAYELFSADYYQKVILCLLAVEKLAVPVSDVPYEFIQGIIVRSHYKKPIPAMDSTNEGLCKIYWTYTKIHPCLLNSDSWYYFGRIIDELKDSQCLNRYQNELYDCISYSRQVWEGWQSLKKLQLADSSLKERIWYAVFSAPKKFACLPQIFPSLSQDFISMYLEWAWQLPGSSSSLIMAIASLYAAKSCLLHENMTCIENSPELRRMLSFLEKNAVYLNEYTLKLISQNPKLINKFIKAIKRCLVAGSLNAGTFEQILSSGQYATDAADFIEKLKTDEGLQMPQQIKKKDEFMLYLKSQDVDMKVLDPLPEPKTQFGPNCGYYAMGIALTYWNESSGGCHKFFPPRKRDVTDYHGSSLREFGKKAIKEIKGEETIGPIFDISFFKKILEKTGYCADIHKFEDFAEFVSLLIASLDRGVPVILPVDRGNDENQVVGLYQGSAAHYLTIVGYIKEKNGILYCLVLTPDNYCYVSARQLFDSCNNLQKSPAKIYKKEDKRWNKVADFDTKLDRLYIMVETELTGLRNQLALIYPPVWKDKTKHITQASAKIKTELLIASAGCSTIDKNLLEQFKEERLCSKVDSEIERLRSKDIEATLNYPLLKKSRINYNR